MASVSHCEAGPKLNIYRLDHLHSTFPYLPQWPAPPGPCRRLTTHIRSTERPAGNRVDLNQTATILQLPVWGGRGGASVGLLPLDEGPHPHRHQNIVRHPARWGAAALHACGGLRWLKMSHESSFITTHFLQVNSVDYGPAAACGSAKFSTQGVKLVNVRLWT